MFKMIPVGFKTYKRLLTAVLFGALCVSAVPVSAQESASIDDAARAFAHADAVSEAQKTAQLLDKYTPETGQTQSLDELIGVARKHSPDWMAATARVALGDAAIEGASELQPYNPEIGGTLGLRINDTEVSKVEVMISQRVDIFGQRGLRIDAARLQKKSLLAAQKRTAWQVAQRVIRDYNSARIGQERLEVEREILAFTQQLFDIAKRRFEAGDEPRASLVVARAELARARQELVAGWVGYRDTLHTLAEHIGWQDDTLPQPTGALKTNAPLPDNARLLEQAFAQDLELRRLNAQLDAARAERAAADRATWPDPRIGIGYERETGDSMPAANILNFAIGVPIPLWNLNKGEIAHAQAKANIAQQALQNRRRSLKNKVVKRAERVRGTQKQVELFEQDVLPALTAQLDMLQTGFELGNISILDVMNARDRLLAVQRQSLDVMEQYLIADSQLHQLLGPAPHATTGETP